MIQPNRTEIAHDSPKSLIEVTCLNDVRVVGFSKDSIVDFEDLVSIAADLEKAVNETSTPNIMIDMDGLTRCSPVLFQFLYEIQIICEEAGGTMRLSVRPVDPAKSLDDQKSLQLMRTH